LKLPSKFFFKKQKFLPLLPNAIVAKRHCCQAALPQLTTTRVATLSQALIAANNDVHCSAVASCSVASYSATTTYSDASYNIAMNSCSRMSCSFYSRTSLQRLQPLTIATELLHPSMDFCPSTDFRPMFVGLPSDFYPTTILHPTFYQPAIMRLAFCHHMSCVLSSCIMRSTILPSYLFVQCPFNFHPTFVRPSCDVHLTSV